MKENDRIPETCGDAVKTIAERLKTDASTAYTILCLESVLWDLDPSDKGLLRIILDDLPVPDPCGDG